LMTFEAARNACKALGDSWHLPTLEEWEGLAAAYGGDFDNNKVTYSQLTAPQTLALQLNGWHKAWNAKTEDQQIGFYWVNAPAGKREAHYIMLNKIGGRAFKNKGLMDSKMSCRCVNGAYEITPRLDWDEAEDGIVQLDQEGNIYNVTLINGKYWLGENLNLNVSGSYCYDSDTSNCKKYGRLYTWRAAKRACEAIKGRLPTQKELEELLNSFTDNKTAYTELIQGGPSKFDARLGGIRTPDEEFFYMDHNAYYWSLNERNEVAAWNLSFNAKEKEVQLSDDVKDLAFSCRCVITSSLFD